MFLEKGKQFKLAEVEEEVLKFWEKEQIFQKSLARRNPFGKATSAKLSASQSKGQKNKSFVFYEGPPYANGRPGIHHVLARVYKDIILRFRSMQGYSVPRRAGWDTHGLPVEIAAEKALGLKSKKDIEQFGIERFNEEAKKAVWLFKDEWENLTSRIGYWLDLKNAYITYENEYIESLWWILKKLSDKKLLFQGHKVVPWCTRCGTALSSHELAQGYKEVTDKTAYVKFKLKPGQKFGKYETQNSAFILAWTTTPWTLPGNVALAVGERISYSAVRMKGVKELYIVASDLIQSVFKDKEIEIAHNDVKGRDLVGLEYEPLFDVEKLQNENSHKIYSASFVTTTDGTGVVHIAPMYGEDDYKLGVAMELPQYHTVSEDGHFTNDVKELKGMMARDHVDSAKETENKIFEILEKNNTLLRPDSYTHEYPFCWRCGTAVIYYARTSWFIGMSTLRRELLSRNKKINWIPGHIQEGRFGEWLREAKDWNLSRERYWGVPLPIWQCKKCHETKVIGSAEELSAAQGGSKNTYVLIRHGQSDIQIKNTIDSGDHAVHLTKKGRAEALATAKKLKKEKFDLIFASPVMRAQETAEIVSETIGVPVKTDERIKELQLAGLSGKPVSAYDRDFPTYESRFEGAPPKAETLRDLRNRSADFLADMEERYRGKKILIVTHEYPSWLLQSVGQGWGEKEAIRQKEAMDTKKDGDFIRTAETMSLEYRVLPRDKNNLADFHRPFIDGVKFSCEKCHGEMKRVPEVADVWFDSGAMPFASAHFPFAEAKNSKFEIRNSKLNSKSLAYPADYISEGMDQTRGWFYTLLAVATALGYPAPYKNVISLGLINDKNGQKMSKSKGNIVEPRSVIDAHGVDAVRWYFYTATPPGEPKNFDEQEVIKAARRYHLVLLNSWVFYDTYGPKTRQPSKKIRKKKSVLDQWIISRLMETTELVTKKLETYDVREAALSLESFLDDFSRWYIRRSRRRLQKPESPSDYKEASETLGQVLYTLTLLTSPFTPFFGEFLYHELEPKKEKDSVHFVDWPKTDKKLINKKLITEMAEVRKIAALVLAKRAELGIKVRQPLSKLKVKKSKIKIKEDLLEILADEVNVKEIMFDKNLEEEIWLDLKITKELREEGFLRELVRQIQDLRQKANTKPSDKIHLVLEASEEMRVVIQKNEKFLKQEVGAKIITFERLTKTRAKCEVKLDGELIWLGIR